MTKIEKKQNQIAELREKQSTVYKEAAEQGQKVLIEKFFKPQGVYFNMGNNEVRVRPELGYTRYNSENENPNFIGFEFIFNNNNWNSVKFKNIVEWSSRRDGEFELGVEFNVHSRYGNGDMISTGDNLKQLAFFGLVADCIAEKKEEIVSTMVETFMPFEKSYQTLAEKIDDLEMHIRVIKEEEEEKAQKALMKKLTTTGVRIKSDARTFDYGYKKWLYQVKHVKILKTSASGQSATMEVTQPDWNNNNVDRITTYERVKVKNIVDFVEDYQK